MFADRQPGYTSVNMRHRVRHPAWLGGWGQRIAGVVCEEASDVFFC